MPGLFGRVRRLTEAHAKAIGKPQVDHGSGQHQQLRCAPKLPRHQAEYPGSREHRGDDTDHSGWENGLRFSPGNQLCRANSQASHLLPW